VLIDGREADAVAADDRGLLYGDGLFETIAVRDGRPCLWNAHLSRLSRGADRLGIPRPDPRGLRVEAKRLLAGVAQGVLRITLTRGRGPRGYRAPDAPVPTRILACHPGPDDDRRGADPRDGAAITLCRTPLGENPRLAGIKHLNRLEQVLARSEWTDPELLEGLMLDGHGRVVCGTMSNLFLVLDDALVTPPVHRCGVAGTVRGLMLEHAAAEGIGVRVGDVSVSDLFRARGLLLTNTLLGARVVARLGDRRYDPQAAPRPLIERVRAAAFRPERPW